jgi:hypothetical protein
MMNLPRQWIVFSLELTCINIGEGEVKVNFNNLRRQLAIQYNSLATELNRKIDSANKDKSSGLTYPGTFFPEDIKYELDSIHNCIATLLCIYDENQRFGAIELDLIEFAPEQD